VADGTTTGYLPSGDVDFFRYRCKEKRQLDIEASPPPRVRVRLEVLRDNDQQVLAETGSARARQSARLLGFPCPDGPVLIRLSQGKRDGNASEPYTLKISSQQALGDGGRH
jgi:hypothetical protein